MCITNMHASVTIDTINYSIYGVTINLLIVC